MNGKDVLPEKYLLEKAARTERFEYLPLGYDLKRQTDITAKQYQGLDKVYEFDKKDDFKRITAKDRNLTDIDLK